MEDKTTYSTVWIWKGIPLKNETSSNGMVIVTEQATEIQENAEVPSHEVFGTRRSYVSLIGYEMLRLLSFSVSRQRILFLLTGKDRAWNVAFA
ncbi:MAG: hypothetical protein ACLUVG_01825 [Phocaeicola vulgatus]